MWSHSGRKPTYMPAYFEFTKFHEELKFKIKYHNNSSSSSRRRRRAAWTHVCKITC
jgi:hypothetical protein